MTERLRQIIYWDRARLENLDAQVASKRNGKLVLEELNVTANGGVLKAEAGFAPSPAETANAFQTLDRVVGALRDSGQLSATRPSTIDDYRGTAIEYVYEFNVRASRVTLPTSAAAQAVGAPPHLLVWVADPNPTDAVPVTPWDPVQTYLYLVEDGIVASLHPGTYDGQKLFMSGCSALWQVVRHAHADGELSAAKKESELFGRGSPAHPVEKLERLGAAVALRRDVQVLYQIRTMTNEQGGWQVSEGRMNDLLAYPLAMLTDGPP